MKILKCK